MTLLSHDHLRKNLGKWSQIWSWFTQTGWRPEYLARVLVVLCFFPPFSLHTSEICFHIFIMFRFNSGVNTAVLCFFFFFPFFPLSNNIHIYAPRNTENAAPLSDNSFRSRLLRARLSDKEPRISHALLGYGRLGGKIARSKNSPVPKDAWRRGKPWWTEYQGRKQPFSKKKKKEKWKKKKKYDSHALILLFVLCHLSWKDTSDLDRLAPTWMIAHRWHLPQLFLQLLKRRKYN